MDDDSRRIEGYALVFNSESRDLGGIIEVIEPSALEGVLDNSDVMCWLNHDSSR
ncbi:MAG: HK97 family phage prohead protease, partial [Muribaculaceae bacterium]|nr:HK97 family phage prohead protease [Muribaculaceae bacterium]